ncbi:MAG: hypothetical protein EB025_08660, partial [Chitinophagaceae bacterium]|nr:hypothetical protein [Chitinophagaceae bacterium]
SSADTPELITEMVNIKIQFHERKIAHSSSEEDIKHRENRIKQLQHQLSALRQAIRNIPTNKHLEASFFIN